MLLHIMLEVIDGMRFFYIQSAYTLFSSINIAFLRPRGTVCTVFLILFENFFFKENDLIN